MTGITTPATLLLPPASIALALALACAALIGFSAHRASLCNVRAVAELMDKGTAHMLGSLLQAVLWMATLSGVLVLVFGVTLAPVRLPDPAGWAVAGGWLFGVGAAINGGCSLSTLHRLADGELGMVATLAGFVAGVMLWAGAAKLLPAATLLPVEPVWIRWPGIAPWLLAALALWALQRMLKFRQLARTAHMARMGRLASRVGMADMADMADVAGMTVATGAARATGTADVACAPPWLRRLLAPHYPLAVAAAVMGLAGGLLYATQGPWSYTNHLRTSVLHAWNGGAGASHAHTALVLALLAGMLGSSLQRGGIRWRGARSGFGWLRHAAGGLVMGAGAAMVPGGNDTLLLSSLPTLTAQAAAAYLSMLAGIGCVLWFMRRARLPMPTIDCTPDGCQEADPEPGVHNQPQGDTP